MFDLFNRAIEVGDYIAWPGTFGNSTKLNVGKVMDITDSGRLLVHKVDSSYGGIKPKNTFVVTDKIIILDSEGIIL